MLSPDYLLRISEGAEEIAEELHADIVNRIIERIMIRIGRGDNYLLTAQDKWQLQVLTDAGYLLEDVQNEITQRVSVMQTEIAGAMEDAGIKAVEYDDVVYRAAGLSTKPLQQSPALIRIMQRNFEATLGEWTNFTGTLAGAAQQSFIKACDKAYQLTMSGTLSYSQAVKEALDVLIADGVTVTYPSGHTDTIETATMRAVRTGISQASGQITDARMEEMGWDIILVSSHMGARPGDGAEDFKNHAWWQGKFYSKSGKDKRFLPWSVCGMGNVQGIHGANCRHSHGPGDGENNPYEHYDTEENRKAYDLQQRQSTLERRIRDTKRQTMNWKTARDNATDEVVKADLDFQYQRKAALLQKQNKAYNDFCRENDLKKRSDRISIAKWDRKQAAAARGAAKRYNESKPVNLKDARDVTTDSGNTHLTALSVQDINERGTKNLLMAYDRRREHYGLNMTSGEELLRATFNTFVEDYTGVSVETANCFEQTIAKLSEKYYTGLTRVEVGDLKSTFGSSVFASVTPKPTVGANTMTLNPHKVGNFEKLKSRIRELSDKGFCVRVPDKHLGEYVATHEFAHTLINVSVSSYKNYVGIDVNHFKAAKKEIETIYGAYMREIGDLSARMKTAEGKFFSVSNQSELARVQKEFLEIKAKLATKQISRYSLENADEFMAEAFADCMIGEKPSEYSKMVVDVLDKFFGRK